MAHAWGNYRPRWGHDELQRVEIPRPEPGGSDLHIYVPLPPRTSYESARCSANYRHAGRPSASEACHRGTQRPCAGRRVYIDYLQNVRGKTLATAYSARASAFAGVSAPLTWQELEHGATPQDFTMRTMPRRIQAIGDMWAALRESTRADLTAVLEH
jgi:bifunctional non-homologous end joining protein LigD